jgi:hypothetical protein
MTSASAGSSLSVGRKNLEYLNASYLKDNKLQIFSLKAIIYWKSFHKWLVIENQYYCLFSTGVGAASSREWDAESRQGLSWIFFRDGTPTFVKE